MDQERDNEQPADLSALAWVNDELRRTLDNVHKSLRRHLREVEGHEKATAAHGAATHLLQARGLYHQGVGALELIGLEEPAKFLAACEQAVQRLALGGVPFTAEVISTLERASFGLLDYLRRLLSSKPVSALALFPQYRAVLTLAGSDRIHPADLWSIRPVIEDDRPDDGTHALPATQVRQRIEAALLDFFRTGELSQARDICAHFTALGKNSDGRLATLWPMAAAFFEAQAAQLLAIDVYAKRMASRLLTQLRRAEAGQTECPDRLLQDVLFFCARSRQDPARAPVLAAVCKLHHVRSIADIDYEHSPLGRFDPSQIPVARRRVTNLKESWSALSAGELSTLNGVVEQGALVVDSVRHLYPEGQKLADSLAHAFDRVGHAGTAPSAELAMEVATTLLCLEASLDEGDLDQPLLQERVVRLAQRLDTVAKGLPPQPLEPWVEDLYRQVSDRQAMGSVVQELRSLLAEVETQLDRFARNPADLEPLRLVPGQFAAMRGVLAVLGLDHATQAIHDMRDQVADLLAQATPDTKVPAVLAENLGALSFLIDMLGVQPQLARSLFKYDAQTGQFAPVMGKAHQERAEQAPAAAPVTPPAQAAAAEEPLPELGEVLELTSNLVAGPVAAPVSAPTAGSQQVVQLSEEDQEMRDIFLEEAREVIGQANEYLDQLQQHPHDHGTLTAVRRAFHTLKGSSRMVGLRNFGEAAWAAEQLFNAKLAEADVYADSQLLRFSTDALNEFGNWVEEVAHLGHDGAHDANYLIQRAQALRLGQPEPQAPAPVEGVAPVESAFTPELDQPLELLPEAVEEEAADAGADEVLDVPSFELDLEPPADTAPAPLLDVEPEISLAPAEPEQTWEFLDAPVSGAELAPAEGAFEFEMLSTDALVPSGEVVESVEPGASVELNFDFTELPELSAQVVEPAEVASVSEAGDKLALEAAEEPVLAGEAEFDLHFDLPAPRDTVFAEPELLSQAEVAAPPAAQHLTRREVAQAMEIPALHLHDQLEPVEEESPLVVHSGEPTLEAPVLDLGFDLPELSLAEELPSGEIAAPDATSELAAEAALPELEVSFDGSSGFDESLADGSLVSDSASEEALPEVSLEWVAESDSAELAPVSAEAEPEALDEAPVDALAVAKAESPVDDALPAVLPLQEPDLSPPVEDGYKNVGSLRIPIALFNIYLNEADEQSRRLSTALAEWQLELHRPLSDTPIALAHSLAGNSATVGNKDLSALARRLEHALEHAQARGQGLAGDAQLFNDAASEIRRLLHQFAAGFLRQVEPELLTRFEAHEAHYAEQISHAAALSEAELDFDALDDQLEEEVPASAEAQSDQAGLEALDALELPSLDISAEVPDLPALDLPTELAETDVLTLDLPELAELPSQQVVEAELAPAQELPVDAVEALPELDFELAELPVAQEAVSAELVLPAEEAPTLEAEVPPQAHTVASAPTEASRVGVFVPPASATGVAVERSDRRTQFGGLDDTLDAVDVIDPELFEIFNEEGQELLPTVAEQLRRWEANPEDLSAGTALMRALHTFKGGARLAGAMRLGELAHRLETSVEHVTARGDLPTSQVLAQLQTGVDALDEEFQRLRSGDLEAPAEAPSYAPSYQPTAAVIPFPSPVAVAAPVAAPELASVAEAAELPPEAVADLPQAEETSWTASAETSIPADEVAGQSPSFASSLENEVQAEVGAEPVAEASSEAETALVSAQTEPTPGSALPDAASPEAESAKPAEALAAQAAPLASAAVAAPVPLVLSQPAQPVKASAAIDWTRFMRAATGGAGAAAAVEGANATLRVRAQLIDRLVSHAGEVGIARARIESDMSQMQVSLRELTDNLERLRRQLRDLELQAETQMTNRIEAARSAHMSFDPLEMDRFTRVQELTRMMAESVNDVGTVQRGIVQTLQSTDDQLASQARLTRDLQDDLLRARMVEFDTLSDRLYRVVRQAAKESSKLVRLNLEGGGIELDRAVLDRMAQAFEHLLRNAVVHGIELPAQREAMGKPATGTVEVRLQQMGNEVQIEVRDDGAGLNLARIAEKARSLGLLNPGEALSESDLAGMIFRPGVTTAEKITELAGRGVGMDVVRAEVTAMGGRIETATTQGQGTSFRMVLPLTTAVTQVVVVTADDLVFAIPSTLVEIVKRITPAEAAAAYQDGVLAHGQQKIPFFWAGSLLESSQRGKLEGRTAQVVVVRSAAQYVALHVDQVQGNQEVVVKNLGPQLARLPGLAGISVLASGNTVLIYNPVALAAVYGEQIRHPAPVQTEVQQVQAETAAATDVSAATAPVTPVVGAKTAATAVVQELPLVMVIDDSLTVRRVTQRLLQREGYRVLLAKDGLDALELLQSHRPAVMLCDIEMPRMDGFDLVRNVRSDVKLADIPVIMITSRIAQKHQDHARELGVDHYLGKPYDEERLLELVRNYADSSALA